MTAGDLLVQAESETLPLRYMGSATFPWDLLKAESLRVVCRDVGRIQGRNRDVMIDFLKSVETLGLTDALNLYSEDTRTASRRVASTATPSAPITQKRIREPVVSHYNTRHRDKRVRLSDPGPGPSRKKVRVTKKVETKQPQTPIVASSRNLGELKSAMKKTLPVKAGRREVFDGVLLRRRSYLEDKGRAGSSGSGEDAASIVRDEAPGGEENGLPSRGESSLADSNKENDLIPGSPSVDDETDTPERDQFRNVEGASQPTHRGLHVATTAMVTSFDDDPDAEGEVIAEEGEHEITITVLQDNGNVLRDVEMVTNGEVDEESEEAILDAGETIDASAVENT